MVENKAEELQMDACRRPVRSLQQSSDPGVKRTGLTSWAKYVRHKRVIKLTGFVIEWTC